jgi:uncharacterized protein
MIPVKRGKFSIPPNYLQEAIIKVIVVAQVPYNHSHSVVSSEIFALPIASVYLLYAPLHHLSALINRSALDDLCQKFQTAQRAGNGLDDILSVLSVEPARIPQPRSSQLTEPIFLGLLPTLGCNMGCRYCDFLNGAGQEMSLETVRRSVDAYLGLLRENQKKEGALHFFGGEPFHAPRPAQFAVEFARMRAEERGIHFHFEATTNGIYDASLARWIADNLDTVVLSLDGRADVQNLHRPLRNGSPSFERAAASALVFSEGDCELVLRACVSNQNVDSLAEIAGWFSQSFHPAMICFEPLSASESSAKNGLMPPDPLTFARRFCEAAEVLNGHGIPAILSTADLSKTQVTACPVGKDALIVTPDGSINACYLPEREWRQAGMEMKLGGVTSKGFQIDPVALQKTRDYSLFNKPLCVDCFCRYSCAGGCHVHHAANRDAGSYDEQCIRTRLVTASLLLDGLGQSRLRQEWLVNEDLAMRTAWQTCDRLPVRGEFS